MSPRWYDAGRANMNDGNMQATTFHAHPNLSKNSFEDYTGWTAVGIEGALAGIVTISMLVLRR